MSGTQEDWGVLLDAWQPAPAAPPPPQVVAPPPPQPPAPAPPQPPVVASTQPPAPTPGVVPPFVPPPPQVPSQAQQVVQDAVDWSSLPVLGGQKAPPTAPAQPTSLRDALTGSSRTQFPDAPEFLSANPGAVQGLRIAAGYLTSAEPAQVADIVRKTLPDARISHDQHGNPMVTWQGQTYYVNKPGASGADMAKLVADIAAFGGAGKLVSAVASFVPRLFVGAGVGAGVSVAQDAASTLLGSEQGIDPGRAAMGAAVGAGSEALLPLAERVGQVVRQFRQMPKLMGPGGTITATATAVLRQAGIDPTAYTQAQLQEILRGAAGAGGRIDAQASGAAAAARGVRQGEFDIPRTAGQRTGDRAQLNLEDTLRHGGLGPTAQTTMQTFDQGQREAVGAAGERIRALAAGRPGARDEGTLGEVVRGQVQTAEQQADAAVQTAYRTAGPLGPGAAQPLAFEIGAANSLTGRLRQPLHDMLIDPSTTPQTMAALARVEALEEAGTVTLGELETTRRAISNAARGNEHTSDGLALIRMRRALDEWADDSLQRGLYAGDQAALERVIAARATRTAYGIAFEPREAPRRVSMMLERALADGVTGQEFFNAIYGAGQLGSGEGTRAAIGHLRTLFPGDNNPVISALREGAVQRLLGGARPAEPSTMLATAQRLDDALQGKGREVLEGLFGREELARLQRYSAELRDLAGLSQKQNNSGTAYKISQMISQAFQMAVGEGVGNLVGAGPVVGSIAGRMVGQGASGVVSAARAASATAPGRTGPARMPLSALVQAGLRGSAQATANQARPDQQLRGLLD